MQLRNLSLECITIGEQLILPSTGSQSIVTPRQEQQQGTSNRSTVMRKIGPQTGKQPPLFKYLLLSVIVSLVAGLLIAAFSPDTRRELAVWLLWVAVVGVILGVIEYALIRKYGRRSK